MQAIDKLNENAVGSKLIAELVTLGGRTGTTYQYADVVAALAKADLDPKTAKEFLPRNAWTRACRQLAKERLIDVVREDGDDAVFQFTKRFFTTDHAEGGQQIEYRKEVKIMLDKRSGKLRCLDEAVLQMAQRELERCMAARTNADVTAIAQKVMNSHADLMPLPGVAGVYLVPIEHRDFLRKVEKFLTTLGRKPYILPIPQGVGDSDRTVQETVVEYLSGLVKDHEAAVEGFSESTRNGTFESAAKRLNLTRLKVEAYAIYLQDRKDELLAAVDAADAKLRDTVAKLTSGSEDAEEVDEVEVLVTASEPEASEVPEPEEHAPEPEAPECEDQEREQYEYADVDF